MKYICDAVNSWPKSLWPASMSVATLLDFLEIDGVWTSARYSVKAAVLIVPSVLFIFLVRKHLSAMWGIAKR